MSPSFQAQTEIQETLFKHNKNLFFMRLVKHPLTTEVVESPSLETDHRQDTALSSHVDLVLTSRVGLDALQRCFSTSVVL